MKLPLTNFHDGDGGWHTTYLLALAAGLSCAHAVHVAAPPDARQREALEALGVADRARFPGLLDDVRPVLAAAVRRGGNHLLRLSRDDGHGQADAGDALCGPARKRRARRGRLGGAAGRSRGDGGGAGEAPVAVPTCVPWGCGRGHTRSASSDCPASTPPPLRSIPPSPDPSVTAAGGGRRALRRRYHPRMLKTAASRDTWLL